MKVSRAIILIILLVNFLFTARSQQISGVVISCKDSTALPYAHIYINKLDGFKGTVSNIDGRFSLYLSEEHVEDTLIFSCLGYNPTKMKAGEFVEGVCLEEGELQLKPVTIWNISARDFLLKTMDKIKTNYYANEGYSRGFYWSTFLEEGKPLQFNESNFSLRNTFNDQIHVEKTYTNIDSSTYQLPVLTGIKNAFYFDFIKSKTGIFNINNILEWTFSYQNSKHKGITIIKAERIDDIDHSYTIYIDNKEYAIVKLEYNLNWGSGKYFKINKDVQYSMNSVRGSVSYEKIGGSYKLKFMKMNVNVDIYRPIKLKKTEARYFSELVVTSFHTSKTFKNQRDIEKQVINLADYCKAAKYFDIDAMSCL